jgi:hypothetical protein
VGAGVAVPLRLTAWGDPSALSVVVKESVRGDPPCVGVKLKTSVQLAPTASEAALDVEVSWGQVELVLILKFAPMLGLLPVVGTAKRSGALPLFATVRVSGLSELVVPTAVEANVRGGGFWAFNSLTRLWPDSVSVT